MPYAKENNIAVRYPERFNVPNTKYSRYYNEKLLFTSEECELIRSYFKTESFRRFPITRADLSLDPNGSHMTEAKFEWDDINSFIYPRITDWTRELGMEFTWTTKPYGMFRRYRKGDYFVRHDDTPWDHDGLPKRFFTIGVQLNDDYEGGDFEIDDHYTVLKKQGNVSLWGIEVPHEVKLITGGIRESLTFFVDVKNGFIGENHDNKLI